MASYFAMMRFIYFFFSCRYFVVLNENGLPFFCICFFYSKCQIVRIMPFFAVWMVELNVCLILSLQKFDTDETLTLKCELLADWIKGARHVVVHTGAGISTSAGIPDFRYVSSFNSRKDPKAIAQFSH